MKRFESVKLSVWSLFVTSLVPSDKDDALILLPFILQFTRCTDFFLSDFSALDMINFSGILDSDIPRAPVQKKEEETFL